MNYRIETRRLKMRQFTLDEIDAVYEFSSHPEVVRYTGDAGIVTTKKDAEKIIRGVWLKEYEQFGYARYALIHKADKKIIGFCGVKFEPEENLPDLGYRMLPEYWGQGLGFEAALATLAYARTQLKLSKIFAEVATENTASIRILEKLGMLHTDSYEKAEFKLKRFECSFE